MSRTRLIRPESAIDPTLAVLDSDTRLLAAYLPCLADKAGVLKDQPLGIRFQIFPAQPTVDVDAMLDTLAAAGALIRYEGTDTSGKAAGPQRLVYLTRFDQDQRPHHSEAASTFTRPSAQGASCGAGSDTQGELPNQPRLVIAPTKIGVVTPHSDSCSDACSDTKGEGVASSECAGAPDQGNQESPPVEIKEAPKPEPVLPDGETWATAPQVRTIESILREAGTTPEAYLMRKGRTRFYVSDWERAKESKAHRPPASTQAAGVDHCPLESDQPFSPEVRAESEESRRRHVEEWRRGKRPVDTPESRNAGVPS
jgi:hypothetical protein